MKKISLQGDTPKVISHALEMAKKYIWCELIVRVMDK